jgi:hypothetical protein
MEKKPAPEKIQAEKLSINLHEGWLERLKNFCVERDIPIEEFVADAILDKLELVYKDRRKRPRL